MSACERSLNSISCRTTKIFSHFWHRKCEHFQPQKCQKCSRISRLDMSKCRKIAPDCAPHGSLYWWERAGRPFPENLTPPSLVLCSRRFQWLLVHSPLSPYQSNFDSGATEWQFDDRKLSRHSAALSRYF